MEYPPRTQLRYLLFFVYNIGPWANPINDRFMFRLTMIHVKNKSPIQPMDVRYEDVLVVASLILVDREAEADGHQFVRGEAAGSRVAQHRTSVLVGVLPAELLQQDVALLHLPALALLTLHSEGLALLHHSHDFCFHTLVYFSLLVQLKLILKYSLQTVNVKYILITLVLRRAFSRPFVINLLACHRGPRVPRTDGAKLGKRPIPHKLLWCLWYKLLAVWYKLFHCVV